MRNAALIFFLGVLWLIPSPAVTQQPTESQAPLGKASALYLVTDLRGTDELAAEMLRNAPELLLHLAATDVTNSTYERGGIRYTSQINHQATQSRALAIPTTEFVRRALAGDLSDADAKMFTMPVESGFVLQVNSTATISGHGMLEMKLVSSLVNPTNPFSTQSIVNIAKIDLILIAKDYAIVNLEEGEVATASLYRPVTMQLL